MFYDIDYDFSIKVVVLGSTCFVKRACGVWKDKTVWK